MDIYLLTTWTIIIAAILLVHVLVATDNNSLLARIFYHMRLSRCHRGLLIPSDWSGCYLPICGVTADSVATPLPSNTATAIRHWSGVIMLALILQLKVYLWWLRVALIAEETSERPPTLRAARLIGICELSAPRAFRHRRGQQAKDALAGAGWRGCEYHSTTFVRVCLGSRFPTISDGLSCEADLVGSMARNS
ncbi:hypothetical protein F5Y00DRAFT_259590 [Daldinia vernicosa]|uniref:uncharacterized protein n=1 Tax=Daldinia vernicosa TaxID=114800 RepID=UPI002007621A|nr:uncharacterized protein F5Y00DRAFT_259590 [Daldinia vernicosa]KAI0851587.1 hypothetical protein F5Y00DRAFT_259590 [Daldinia vernicosa]